MNNTPVPVAATHRPGTLWFASIVLFLVACLAFLLPHIPMQADPRLTLSLGHDAPEHTWSAQAIWSGIHVDPESSVEGSPNWPLSAAGTLFPTVLLPWSWLTRWSAILAVMALLWSLTLAAQTWLLCSLAPDRRHREAERGPWLLPPPCLC